MNCLGLLIGGLALAHMRKALGILLILALSQASLAMRMSPTGCHSPPHRRPHDRPQLPRAILAHCHHPACLFLAGRSGWRLECFEVREFHNDVDDMVKCFVQYMPCDKQVQREVAACGRSVELRTIQAFRAQWQRRMMRTPLDQDDTVVWMDQRYTRDMVKASERLALAIMKARAA